MWNKIKKFFKWIADHTGISWIARKISSGWKWLFGGKANITQQNTSQQEESPISKEQEPAQAQSKGATTPKALDDEVNPDQSIPPAAPDEPQGPVINTSETDAKELPENFSTPNLQNADSNVLENYLKVEDGGKLLLILTPEQLAKCKENNESTRLNKLLVYIKCDANEYRIIGSVDKKTILVQVIRKKNENGQFEGISAKEILGNATVKKVDSISNRAFEAPTLEQPNLNATSHDATQQVATDQTAEQPASGSEVASPSGSQPTTAGPNEPKSERIEISDKRLALIVNADKENFMQTCKNPSDSDEYLVYIEHAKGILRITGSTNAYVSAGNKNELLSFPINSVATQDGTIVSGKLVEMKKMLDLNENKKFIEITRISEKPPKTATLEQPNLNATSHDATQQVATDQTAEQSTSGSDILPEDSSEVASPSGKQPTTPNQPVNQDNMAGSKPSPTKQVDKVSAQDLDRIEEMPNSEPKRESSTINIFNGNLKLRFADDIQQKLEDYKHPLNNGKYRMEIHCKKDKFNITFNKIDNADGSLIINTLQKQDGNSKVEQDTCKIINLLGFKRGSPIIIDSIHQYQSGNRNSMQEQYTAAPKVVANGNIPNSETVNPRVQSHTASTSQSVNQ